MLGFNTFAADTDEQAQALFSSVQQAFVNLRSGRPGKLPPPMPGYAEGLNAGERAMIDQALACSAVGGPATVRAAIEAFVAKTGADELMIASMIHDHEARRRSLTITAEVMRNL